MKAIIFNSGLGHRMGDETKTHHKSTTLLKNGETIFHRQLRLLIAEGVKDFIITTGPFAEQPAVSTISMHSAISHPFCFIKQPPPLQNSRFAFESYAGRRLGMQFQKSVVTD